MFEQQDQRPTLFDLDAFAAAWRGRGLHVSQSARLDPADLQTTLFALKPELSRRREAGIDMNVWKIAGVGRNEVRNTAVLTWLLSPQGSHGLGGRILSALLTCICQGKRFDAATVTAAMVIAEERPMGSLDDRIDISIHAGGELVFIEAKIDAPFAAGQVDRYREQLRLKALACGTGSTLATLTVRPSPVENVPSITWMEMASTIRGAVATVPETIGKAMALQYANHIEQFW